MRALRLLLIPFLFLALLVGCGSSDDSSNNDNDTETTTRDESSNEDEEEEEEEEESSSDEDAIAFADDVRDAFITWADSITEVTESFNSISSSQDPDAILEDVVTGFQSAAESSRDSADEVADIDPRGIDGAEEGLEEIQDAFNQFADALDRLADDFGALDPTSDTYLSDVGSLTTDYTTEVTEIFGALSSLDSAELNVAFAESEVCADVAGALGG